jgi:hypothetical protein
MFYHIHHNRFSAFLPNGNCSSYGLRMRGREKEWSERNLEVDVHSMPPTLSTDASRDVHVCRTTSYSQMR